MDIIEVIKKRRSARSFLKKSISDEILKELLEAARYSPSGGNGQNWYFGIVRDDAMKTELAKAAGGQEWITFAPVIIVCCALLEEDLKDANDDDFGLIVNYTRYGEDFVKYMNNYKNRFIANTFWNNGVPLIPGEHILLTAVKYGISGCFIGYLDLKKTNEILNLPENITSLYLIPLGYAKEDPSEIYRKQLQEIVFYEKWNN